MIYAAAFLVAYVTILLKVFQQKNVVGNHYRAVFVTSHLLALGEAAAVLLVVHKGLAVAVATGFGAGMGAITGMWLHNKFIKRRKLCLSDSPD